MENPPKFILFEHNKKIPGDSQKFLKVKRKYYQLSYPDGSTSELFLHDVVQRKKTDASVMIAHYKYSGVHTLYLRSAIRPALGTRFDEHLCLWELPAGLCDAGETPAQTAARETKEELGFNYPAEEFRALGNFSYSSPGIASERLFYFEVEVDPSEQKKPSLDGSALEKHGKIIQISIDEAINELQKGTFLDAKTEVGIRRFVEKYR